VVEADAGINEEEVEEDTSICEPFAGP